MFDSYRFVITKSVTDVIDLFYMLHCSSPAYDYMVIVTTQSQRCQNHMVSVICVLLCFKYLLIN